LWAGLGATHGKIAINVVPKGLNDCKIVIVRSLPKKFVQYVYKNFILQILGYFNMVPLKIFPI